jgi:hypothetical protein
MLLHLLPAARRGPHGVLSSGLSVCDGKAGILRPWGGLLRRGVLGAKLAQTVHFTGASSSAVSGS